MTELLAEQRFLLFFFPAANNSGAIPNVLGAELGAGNAADTKWGPPALLPPALAGQGMVLLTPLP